MSRKDAKAIAGLMRRQHGDYAERFIARQIAHFQRETAAADAVAAWQMVAAALAGDFVVQRAQQAATAQAESATLPSSQATEARAA
jgi:hypothetical protein